MKHAGRRGAASGAHLNNRTRRQNVLLAPRGSCCVKTRRGLFVKGAFSFLRDEKNFGKEWRKKSEKASHVEFLLHNARLFLSRRRKRAAARERPPRRLFLSQTVR